MRGLEWILHKVCLEIFQPAAENKTLQRYQTSVTQIRSQAEIFQSCRGKLDTEFTLILIRIGHSDLVSDSRGYQPQNLYKPQPSGTAFLQSSGGSKYLLEWAETQCGTQPYAYMYTSACSHSIAGAFQKLWEYFLACTFWGVFFLPARKQGLSAKCVHMAKRKL